MGLEAGLAINSGNESVHKDFAIASIFTGAALWTPATGKRFVITSLTLVVAKAASTTGTVTIYDGSNVQHSRVFQGTLDPDTTIVYRSSAVYRSQGIGNVLRLTTTSTMAFTIVIEGYEE